MGNQIVEDQGKLEHSGIKDFRNEISCKNIQESSFIGIQIEFHFCVCNPCETSHVILHWKNKDNNCN